MADVICPQCGGRYHETTGMYRPGVTTTGDMLTLKKTYRDNGWSSFYEDSSVAFGGLECPECGGCYSHDGVAWIDREQYEKELRFEIPGTRYTEPAVKPAEAKRGPGRPKGNR